MLNLLAKMWRKRNTCAPLVRMPICAPTMENSMEIPQKTKIRTTISSSDSTYGYLSQESKNTNTK